VTCFGAFESRGKSRERCDQPEHGEIQDGVVIKILILAGRLDRSYGDGALGTWLDRLEQRGLQIQVLCRASDLNSSDPRLIESSSLGNRWLRGRAIRHLRSAGRLQHPDMIHLIDGEMVELALALSQDHRLPYVQTVSTFAALERGLRISHRWCRRLIATNDDIAHAMPHDLGISAEHISVIPPGIVPLQKTDRAVGRREVPVIGAGGPPEETSGLMTFLDAAHILMESGYDVEFVLATHSGRQAELRRRAKQLQIGERVTVGDYSILGAQFWNALDVYCQPAVVASAGHAVGRALAHGVPTIATNVRGLRTWIESGTNGLIVSPGEAPAIATAIIFLIDHPDEARRLTDNGLATLQTQFNPEDEANRLAALYERELTS